MIREMKARANRAMLALRTLSMLAICVAAHAQPGAQAKVLLSVDVPGPQSETLRGSVHFTGWALERGALISRVEISVDGVSAGLADTAVSRPDVCATYTDATGCPEVGWTFIFDADSVAPGKHKVLVTARASDGNEVSVAREIVTGPGAPASGAGIHARDTSATPDFQLAINPTSLSINTGTTGIATVQVSALASFNGSVTFTCSLSGLTGATCAIPGTVTSSGTATLIINAPATIARTPLARRLLPPNGTTPLLWAAPVLCAFLCVMLAGRRRRALFTAGAAVALLVLAGCEDGSSDSTPAATPPPTSETGSANVTAVSGSITHSVSASITINASTAESELLTAQDVSTIVQNAAEAIDTPSAVFAVTDRLGNVLGVYCSSADACSGSSSGNFGTQVKSTELAVALARTAAFFSNDTAPLSSRTVRYISGVHFPPGVSDTSNGPLYGIENTNRGCPLDPALVPGSSVANGRTINGSQPGFGIITGKPDVYDSGQSAVNPGGVPLYKSNTLVGGIGVAGVAGPVAEYAGVAAEGSAYAPTPATPGVVVINGIQVPFVTQTTAPAGVQSGTPAGTWVVAATASPGAAPDGYLLGPKAGPLGGLSQSDVDGIVQAAVAEGNLTRAVIRLPPGARARFAIAVADLDGSLLALYRMPDATVFSIDVAVAKARNVVYFSGPDRQPSDLPGVPSGTAVTNRTIGFGAQPFFPPGIDGSAPGPFFPLYTADTANPCTQGRQASNGKQNGIVFFPGSAPLYRSGALVGGLGVSGDGVDQDDFVANAGASNFEAPAGIRADQIVIDGVRLPYQNFPRNPTN